MLIERLQIKAEDFYNLVRQTKIKTKIAHNSPLAQKSRIDLSWTLDKNFSDGLVKFTQEFAKLVTETSGKMYKLKTYNKIINISINRNRGQEAIDKLLSNLVLYYTITKLEAYWLQIGV